jgi:dTDP-4-amino-4,6-dideoxygalactose transaminase
MRTTTSKVESVKRAVPFHRAPVGEEEAQAVAAVVRSGWLTMGPKTVEFEQRFADYIGARHAIAVSSCTAAMHLALEAIGIRPGDEVLVPTLTFAATAEVVTYLQARPILVDSDPMFFNVSPEDAARKITSRTRAIIPVHFAGHPCQMDNILGLAEEHGLAVVEDAAHALPARYRGKKIGTLSRATAFSFYATKTLTTGEGGMVTTNEDSIAERTRLMRLHGMSRDAWKRYSGDGAWQYEVLEAGFKYNFTDIQAALGLVQLAKCDLMHERRQAIASQYTRSLSSFDSFRTPCVADDVEPSWHLYYILIEEESLRIGRDQVMKELQARGVQTSVHFIPLHEHPFYQKLGGHRRGDFPTAEDYSARCISLPIYSSMSSDDVDSVIYCLEEIAREFRR